MYKLKPKGQRMHEPLSEEEKKQILELTREGKLKRHEIARIFRVHPQTIKYLCERNGLGRWAELTPELEQRVVALLREGRAVYRVAKATRLQGKAIREVMEKYKIHHPVGGGPKLPAAKRAEIAQAVRNREDYLYRLAKKFKVERATVRRIAREITGVTKFIGYPNIEPFSPVYSDRQLQDGYEKFLEAVFRDGFSREAQVEEQNQNFVKLVESFAQIWYKGKIPTDRNEFIGALLESYMPRLKPPFITMLTEAEYAKERELIACYIRRAVELADESRWTN
jgi:transposase-like protein